jgi:glycosyltransferase involved in cell wall biosynthesis
VRSRRRPEERPIALLLKTYPKLSETFVLNEIRGLERRGYALRIYALAAPEDDESRAAARDVRAPVAYLPATARDALRVIGAHIACLCTRPAAWATTLARALRRHERCGLVDFLRAAWLARALEREGATHLHTHFASEPAGVAELAARLAGLPFSISAHAKDIWLSSVESLRRKLGAASFTVTCTEHNRAHLAAIAPDARILRMYHGVELHRLQPPPARPSGGETPLILSVGRLRPKKGLLTLVDACAHLHAAGVELHCEIVGYGPEQERLEAAIAAYGLRDVVVLTGRLAHDEVLRRYARADVFVLPCTVLADGDRDGIPNVLLEAMAMALPVISTNVSGIPELIDDGRNGVLVEPDDARALAGAIAGLLVDDAERMRLGAAARATVAMHFTERNLDTLCRLLPPRSRGAARAMEELHVERA